MAGPFSGLLVVDLTRVLAGPYCALLMAELGARVIKVEAPGTGDASRSIGPFIKTKSGKVKSGYFMSVNRGKESIALDLKTEGDRKIFDALLSRADVLIENYRGGTMEKLGFGWDALKEKYPKLIYAGVSGFGHTGPYANRPAYDMVVQAMGGIMSLTGHPGIAADARGFVDGRSHGGIVHDHRHCIRALRPHENRAWARKWMCRCSIARWRYWRTRSRAMSRRATCPAPSVRAIPPSRRSRRSRRATATS